MLTEVPVLSNDPFTRVGQQQISIEVSSVIRASPDSFRIAWTERHYEGGHLARSGALDRHPWHRRPTAEGCRAAAGQPLGIYINSINWSREMSQ